MRSMNGRRLGASACFLIAAFAPATAAAQAYFAAPTQLSGDSHWTNYIRIADVDGDVDLDVIVPNASGFFGLQGSQISAQPFQIFLNNGQAVFSEGTAATVGAFNKCVRQVALGDVDADGDPDMYVPDCNALGPD